MLSYVLMLQILDTSLEKISRVTRTVEDSESNSELENQDAPTEQQEVDYLNLGNVFLVKKKRYIIFKVY